MGAEAEAMPRLENCDLQDENEWQRHHKRAGRRERGRLVAAGDVGGGVHTYNTYLYQQRTLPSTTGCLWLCEYDNGWRVSADN